MQTSTSTATTPLCRPRPLAAATITTPSSTGTGTCVIRGQKRVVQRFPSIPPPHPPPPRPPREEVRNCTACVSATGCGYCLSTLSCMDGTATGPGGGIPCPNWVEPGHPNVCPAEPRCRSIPSCTKCAAADECAWCASKAVCLSIEDVFTENCRGTVFELPCPASFVEDNRVQGNLAISGDPLFGGGFLRVTGGEVNASGGVVPRYLMAMDDDGFTAVSRGDMTLRATTTASPPSHVAT